MTLDIIIPALNESKNLEKLIPYLKNQILNSPTKVIVVDGSRSSDNTEDLCRELEVNYIRCHASQRSKQMNLGAINSQAEILLFLHADVLPPKGFLQLIKNEIRNGKRAGMFAYRFDKDSLLLKINAFFTKYDGLFAGGGDQCLFIENKLFHELGGFNDEYVIMEDFDFFRLLKKEKIPYTIIQERAEVSSRKYKNNSYLRVNLVNLWAFARFKLDTAPDKINKSYQYWLR